MLLPVPNVPLVQTLRYVQYLAAVPKFKVQRFKDIGWWELLRFANSRNVEMFSRHNFAGKKGTAKRLRLTRRLPWQWSRHGIPQNSYYEALG
jgi:hypothetical protein